MVRMENELIELLRIINLLVSLTATFMTCRLFCRFLSARNRYTNGNRETYLVLLSTFGLFFLYSLLNVLTYTLSFVDFPLAGSMDIARVRTLVSGIGTILLVIYYDKVDNE